MRVVDPGETQRAAVGGMKVVGVVGVVSGQMGLDCRGCAADADVNAPASRLVLPFHFHFHNCLLHIHKPDRQTRSYYY